MRPMDMDHLYDRADVWRPYSVRGKSKTTARVIALLILLVSLIRFLQFGHHQWIKDDGFDGCEFCCRVRPGCNVRQVAL